MAFNRATTPVYLKGTMDVWCHNPSTGDLDYYSNKVQTSQFTTTVNMSPINASVGNPVVINLPDSAEVSLTLTAANMSLEARALSVGGDLSYNGIVPVIESITANGNSISVSQAPVAGYGMAEPYAFIDTDGKAYVIDADTYQIQGFTAQNGQSYCVRYFVRNASAQQLRIASNFAPSVEVVTIRMPAYNTQGSSSNQGSKCGDFYIWIPRMQFSGKADTEGSQTTAATTDFSGTALAYDEAVSSGVCSESAATALAYMVYVPLGSQTVLVEGLAVVGGSVTVAKDDTVQLPVKYVINNQLVQPDYADLDYESSADATATISDSGVITGVAAGSCTITASLTEPALTVTVDCTVTAS